MALRSPLSRVESNALRSAAAKKNLLAGSAVSHSQLKNAPLTPILAEQCNILVAENEMKGGLPSRNADDMIFAAADDMVAFAERNDMRVPGHNLRWHEGQPPWFAGLVTRENASEILKEHVHNVAGHYAGRIHSWDVVNEAINPEGGPKDGMRDSLWIQRLGLRYIGIAFHAAAEADPKALLTYNDFGFEDDNPYNEHRREITLEFLKWMRRNQIPIHALGCNRISEQGMTTSRTGVACTRF